MVGETAGLGRLFLSGGPLLQRLLHNGVVIGIGFLLCGTLAAQTATSRAEAHALVSLLIANKMDAVAAQDPKEPGRFIAALYIPGSQLLVVSARHPSIAGLEYRLKMKQYRDVYLDLQGTPIYEGKFFVQDSGADGLSIVDDMREVDVIYENGTHQMTFGGTAAHGESDQYAADRRSADERYGHMLQVLTQSIAQSNEESRRPESSASSTTGCCTTPYVPRFDAVVGVRYRTDLRRMSTNLTQSRHVLACLRTKCRHERAACL